VHPAIRSKRSVPRPMSAKTSSPKNHSRARPKGPEQVAGIHPVLEAIRANRRAFRVLRIRGGELRPEVEEVIDAATAGGIRIERVSGEQLNTLAGPGVNAQGVVLEAGRLPEVPLAELVSRGISGQKQLIALDGVEDPQNVGAIARVAEAAGVGGMILTRRRCAPLSPAVSRASAGAIEWLPCARVPNLPRALNQLKSEGFWIFGSDSEAGVDLFEIPDRVVTGDRVVVLGAEGKGMRRGVDRVLDHRLRVPLGGRIASLNVSAAASVILFELKRRSRLATSA
jgi:23S rRNA (guanosine2251-2'-O)-methyltransferase